MPGIGYGLMKMFICHVQLILKRQNGSCIPTKNCEKGGNSPVSNGHDNVHDPEMRVGAEKTETI